MGPTAGVENLAPTRIRSPDCPASSESLYRLRYPDPGMRAAFWNKQCGTKADARLFVTARSLNVRGAQWLRNRTILISIHNDAFMPVVLAHDS